MHFTLATIATLFSLSVASPMAKRQTQQPTGYTGDLTYYGTGLGSCGITSNDADPIVALSISMMANGANPNNNPICGQQITINYNGVLTQATVVDTCQACADDDLDASPTLFQTVAPNGNGRVHDVNWWFSNTPDGLRPS